MFSIVPKEKGSFFWASIILSARSLSAAWRLTSIRLHFVYFLSSVTCVLNLLDRQRQKDGSYVVEGDVIFTFSHDAGNLMWTVSINCLVNSEADPDSSWYWASGWCCSRLKRSLSVWTFPFFSIFILACSLWVFSACDDSLWAGLSRSVRRCAVWGEGVISALTRSDPLRTSSIFISSLNGLQKRAESFHGW